MAALPTTKGDGEKMLSEYGWVRNRMARQLLVRAHR